MRIRVPANVVLRSLLLGSLLLGAAAAAGSAAAKSPVVVVELFTSQGCASCFKSGDLMSDLSDRPRVLALTFGVDYWDYLGWQDTFAKSEFTERQRAYLKPLALRDVYTPQVVVDGRFQAAANHPDAVDGLIKDAGRDHPEPPQIMAAHGSRIAIGSGRAPKGGADVWLVRYDPRDQKVKIRTGDNRGKTIVEHNVVRELVRLGGWKGSPKSFRATKAGDGLETAVIVQVAHGGRIVAAKKL